MSRSLLYKFINYIKDIHNSTLFDLSYSEKKIFKYFSLGVSGLILGGHACYTYGTTQNKTIYIDKKYTFDRNGFTEFMIIDNTGKHYNVNNSFWYWKWDSIEDWHKMDTSKEMVIKYYGWRVPLFGIFPNIIMSNQDVISNFYLKNNYSKKQNND